MKTETTRLTEATRLRFVAGGAFLAVFEGTGKAVLVPAAETFPCSWLVEAYTEDGVVAINCGAASVGFANGWACENGHSHVSGAEYYEEEEVVARLRAGDRIAPNARYIDGRLV